jgi:hypothetical protein
VGIVVGNVLIHGQLILNAAIIIHDGALAHGMVIFPKQCMATRRCRSPGLVSLAQYK